MGRWVEADELSPSERGVSQRNPSAALWRRLMCGVAGFLGAAFDADAAQRVAEGMEAALAHRGPDEQGTWTDPATGVALAHRRLSIIDLSSEGSQPMVSASGRYVVAYNGEVYNHHDLRSELSTRGHKFRGHSDTEVVLAAIEEWGLVPAIRRFNGMFAFALWDRHARILHLVRDRIGIKPMFYGNVGDAFVFASELKAIRTYPGFNASVDREALSAYMRHGFVPDPLAIYDGFRKLPPGCVLSLAAVDSHSPPDPVAYWSASDIVLAGIEDPLVGTEEEAIEMLDDLLSDAVRSRMVADVPLGAFLSGGYDSTTVVALMQRHSSAPVRTFTIGSTEAAYDEAAFANRVAHHLGTEHTELYVTPQDALDVVDLLPTLYDEPFADSSQIPTFLVSRLARSSVTVSLSGDGGDELFGGYNRHIWGPKIRRQSRWVPTSARRAMSTMLMSVRPDVSDRAFNLISPGLPERARVRLPGEKIHKAARAIRFDDPAEFYLDLTSHWHDPVSVVIGVNEEPATRVAAPIPQAIEADLAQQMMLWDLLGYLPGDILTKLDRASMGVSLEARVPLLDHRVVEFAWRLPANLKLRNGEGKWILRRVLDRYVPRSLVDRPKTGFGIPLDDWLRGPLRDWAEDLLSANRLASDGYLDPKLIRATWSEHLHGKVSHQQVWNALMFEAWLEAH